MRARCSCSKSGWGNGIDFLTLRTGMSTGMLLIIRMMMRASCPCSKLGWGKQTDLLVWRTRMSTKASCVGVSFGRDESLC